MYCYVAHSQARERVLPRLSGWGGGGVRFVPLLLRDVFNAAPDGADVCCVLSVSRVSLVLGLFVYFFAR